MRIIDTISELGAINAGSVLTIGNFDGVHLGHQQILAAARQAADKRQTELVVMTFEPHPVAILYPEKAPGILTPLKFKSHLLAEYGVDCLVVIKDCQELLSLSPEDFVDKFLLKSIRPSLVIEGENFNFGAGRTGNVKTLHYLGEEKGFEVRVVESKEARLSIGHSVKMSSTIIRNILESGKASDASIALGRFYRLIGKIVSGHSRGRKLGFPTANMQPPGQVIPAEGVYAGYAVVADSEQGVCEDVEKIPAVFSVGRSSTYGGDNPLLIEAHLLAEDVGELCGKWMGMDFVEYLRDQCKFENDAELSGQIAMDCAKAREILKD